MEPQKELALEEMKQKTELDKLELQHKKLNLNQERKQPGSTDDSTVDQSGAPVASFDITGNLGLLPKFNEKDPASFFPLFGMAVWAMKQRG